MRGYRSIAAIIYTSLTLKRSTIGINGVRPYGTVEKSLSGKPHGKSPRWKVPPFKCDRLLRQKIRRGAEADFRPLAKKHTAYYITLACCSDSWGHTCAVLAL